MCGIVGYVGAQQAAPILLEGLQKLEYRGYDSAGIAVLDGSTIELAKACGVIKNLFAKTHDGEDLHGYIGLGHTRWATHGAPTEANAHPQQRRQVRHCAKRHHRKLHGAARDAQGQGLRVP